MPYSIKNWEKYQVRVDRPGTEWVKLHKSLIDSADFYSIPINRRWEWPLLLLMCDRHDGIIDKSNEQIGFMLYKDLGKSFDPEPFLERLLIDLDLDLKISRERGELVTTGIQLPPTATTCHQLPPEDKNPHFTAFWSEYPGTRKQNKVGCLEKWKAEKLEERWLTEVQPGLKRCKSSMDWMENNGKFVPAPLVWLRREGWNDEMAPAKPKRAANNGFY